MHGICLGVARKVSSAWRENGQPYSLTEDQVSTRFPISTCWSWWVALQIATLNRRILAFQPPKCFTKLPREFAPNKYKAHELRAFLNHYSCFALNGVLKDCYLQHWRLLVFAYKTLCSDSISSLELVIAGDNLREFVRQVPELYGRNLYIYLITGCYADALLLIFQGRERSALMCTNLPTWKKLLGVGDRCGLTRCFHSKVKTDGYQGIAMRKRVSYGSQWSSCWHSRYFVLRKH